MRAEANDRRHSRIDKQGEPDLLIMFYDVTGEWLWATRAGRPFMSGHGATEGEAMALARKALREAR